MDKNCSNQLTDDEIQEFKKLVEETKGIKLTDEEASEQALRLILLVEGYIKFKQNKVDI